MEHECLWSLIYQISQHNKIFHNQMKGSYKHLYMNSILNYDQTG